MVRAWLIDGHALTYYNYNNVRIREGLFTYTSSIYFFKKKGIFALRDNKKKDKLR